MLYAMSSNAPSAILAFALVVALSVRARLAAGADTLPDGVLQNLVLAPGDNNPRNSDGDFVNLTDGRVLFIYSHFTGGNHNDSAADLCSRVSSDQGRTWSDRDEPVIEAKAQGVASVMSVSLLRLADDRIALFYLAKKSDTDSRLVMRTSRDEARTWSEPAVCSDGAGYAIVTNGRAVQLKGGRIIVPAAWHDLPVPPGGFDRASPPASTATISASPGIAARGASRPPPTATAACSTLPLSN
jgi:hypothetical protein